MEIGLKSFKKIIKKIKGVHDNTKMIRVLPDWWMETEKRLDKVILESSLKNCIDWSFLRDSKGIEEGKSLILHSLLRIYDNVGIGERERQEEFMKPLKKKKMIKSGEAKK